MARVTGIGGFFFRARDPDALNRWYAEHFGVVMIDSRGHEDPGWFQERGECVFSAFAPDSEPFGMAVEQHAGPYPNGVFAELADPEGNPIQLWEPNEDS